MRLKRFRQSTIKNYLQWIKRYILFHHKKHPKEVHDN
ncbi:phage integrase N-terminal SAM-like domain-containing protein [Aliivibrio kagoshimensis]